MLAQKWTTALKIIHKLQNTMISPSRVLVPLTTLY